MLTSYKPITLIIKRSIVLLALFLSACASFDQTNIKPGQRVDGFTFSFEVPTETPWFAVVYGTSHRLKLSQLNQDDSYSILVTLTRGPRSGMYSSANAHLQALKRHLQLKRQPKGLVLHHQAQAIDTRYGELCIRQTSNSEDWRGRAKPGPALIDSITLTCPHPGFANVLISTTLSRRYETHAATLELTNYADQLFASFEFEPDY